jgi:hypothetical protein
LTATGSYLIEDFIDAITVQLDRVQDALRVKAVNRPLTYALKELTLDLQVFVELDSQGNVRFRSSGPNEAGASTVHLGFTTITKPMIEENTISLAATRSPSLEQAGLSMEERRRLERLGVRTTSQLNELKSSTGLNAVARLSSMPIERLRAALQLGRPSVQTIEPAPTPAAPLPAPQGPRAALLPVIRIAPGTSRLQLNGANLLGQLGPPDLRLNNETLELEEAEDHRIVARVPNDAQSGTLDVLLPNGENLQYELRIEEHHNGAHTADANQRLRHADPWAAGQRGR